MSVLVKVLLVMFFILLLINIAIIITFNRRAKKVRREMVERKRVMNDLQKKLGDASR